RELRMAGAKHIFYISSVEETGIEELRAYLED
ncbi:ethanolamine utilization protein EutP, partial [Listeria monocytogenes]|nr:ethanolamine utilization protein EutP [Listeria monocytogenes]